MNNRYLLIKIIIIFLFYQTIKLNANDNETYINSNNITYNEKDNIVELAKNSKININDINVLIDKGIIDYNNNTIEVFGNFYLYEDLNILSGNNLVGDTNLDYLSAIEVNYIYNNDLKIDSKKFQKRKDTLYFYDNFLSPCKLDGYFNCPTWSLRIDKTTYDIDKDRFSHFDSFLQIADYKVFYAPYFTHYGNKAPRQKGFLTPTIEFTIGGNQGIRTPYYLPLGITSDILFEPKIYFSKNFEFLDNFELNTSFNKINSGGNTTIFLENIKNAQDKYINSTFKIDTSYIIDKESVFSASGTFTNSVSTTRSLNDEPLTFENLYIRLENYNFFINNDYLRTELSSIESFDSTDTNLIPISPNINYSNVISFEKSFLTNDLNLTYVKRDESDIDNPSESLRINLLNKFHFNKELNNINLYNGVSIANNFINNKFNHDSTLNKNLDQNSLIIYSDFFYEDFNYFKPRIKLIKPIEINSSNNSINEDSLSISFNYQNQFSENRFFGNDVFDNTTRATYGIESQLKMMDKMFDFKINQSYDFNENSNYANKINQNSHFSDYAVEFSTSVNKTNFQVDARLDNTELEKKEINYSFGFNRSPINFNMDYHETESDAYENYSNDTKSLNIGISTEINENISFSYGTNMDLKNNYDPYSATLGLKVKDECSELKVIYSNTRFNDNYNTKPSETISINFYMDYLGFFGYEQSTDLFFEEAGSFYHGN